MRLQGLCWGSPDVVKSVSCIFPACVPHPVRRCSSRPARASRTNLSLVLGSVFLYFQGRRGTTGYKKTPTPLGVGSHFSIFYFGNFILPFWKIRFALFKKNIAAAVYFNSTTVTPSSPSPYIPARKDLTNLFRFSISRTALRRIPAPRPWMI